MEPVNVFDYEFQARACIEPGAWNYYQDGANDGITLRANRRAFERIQLRPRVLDGGIRRGTDVLKALVLGARAVLVGRPILWGLAVNGADGVYNVLELLRAEIELAMALAGTPQLSSIDHSLVMVREDI